MARFRLWRYVSLLFTEFLTALGELKSERTAAEDKDLTVIPKPTGPSKPKQTARTKHPARRVVVGCEDDLCQRRSKIPQKRRLKIPSSAGQADGGRVVALGLHQVDGLLELAGRVAAPTPLGQKAAGAAARGTVCHPWSPGAGHHHRL